MHSFKINLLRINKHDEGEILAPLTHIEHNFKIIKKVSLTRIIKTLELAAKQSLEKSK